MHLLIARLASVAGVDAPAFVERTSESSSTIASRCVAGVDAPAFVERSFVEEGTNLYFTCSRG